MAAISTNNYVPLPAVKLSNDPLFQMTKPVDGFDAVKDGEAIAQKIRETAKPLEDEITVNKTKITELGILEAKTQALVDALQPLTNYLGVVSSTPNVFSKKVATSLHTDGSIAVTVGSDVKISEVPIKIMVNQMAQYDHIGSSNASAHDYFTSTTDGLGISGNIVINGTTIPITDGLDGTHNMTLKDVANAINSDITDVKAEIVTINNVGGASQYRLVLRANSLAKPIDLTGTDPSIFSGLKLPEVTTDLETLLAKFTYNGDLITRSTNAVKDLIPGLTFDLLNESSTGVTTVIKPDRNAVIDAVTAFKNAYNDLNDALNRNSKVGSDSKPLPDAVLYGHRILETVRSLLSQGTNGMVAGARWLDFSDLTKIGITIGAGADGKTTDLSGKMYLDEKVLEQAVYENYDKVQSLLGNTTSSGVNFSIREIPSSLPASIAGKDISIAYYKTAEGDLQASLSVSGQEPVLVSLDPIRNRVIEGPKGSIFAGLTIAYTGSINPTDFVSGGEQVSEDIWATQGIADSFMNFLKPTLIRKIRETDSLQGEFEISKEIILSQNKTQQQHIDDVYKRAERFKQDIIDRMGEVYRQQGKLGEVNDILDAMHAALMGRG
jgi:flagellar capping protein FliD